MAVEINKADWIEALEDAARRAADARIEFNRGIGATPSEGDAEKYFDAYLAELKKKVPFDGATSDDLDGLYGFKGENMMKWVDSNFRGPSPKETAKITEAAKYAGMLNGIAKEGESWYEMGADELRGRGAELGFKTGTKEGFKEFLDTLGEYQQQADRAANVKELRESPWYIPGMMVAPSAVQAIENATATGVGGDASDIRKLAAIDLLTNAGIMAAPGMNIVKASPIINGAINSGVQGGIELGRQFAANANDNSLEVSPSAALLALSLGATRPGMIGTVQGFSSKIPGKAATEFSRGVMKASRAGNPAWQERNNLEWLAKDFNERMLKGELAPNSKDVLLNLTEAQKLKATAQFPKMAETLGVKPNKNGTYNVGEVMKAYDKQPVVSSRQVLGGIASDLKDDTKFVLTPDNENAYKAAFGAKVMDEQTRSPWSKIGLGTGKFLGEFGGSVEPAIKGNPFKLDEGLGLATDYKKSAWYKKLTSDQKKLVDEKMREKAEE